MRLHPGEVAGTGWTIAPLSDVVSRLLTATEERALPRIIALDGRGGAGKTVLCEQLVGLVPNSAVVHTDDIAWFQACFDWAQLLIDGVLRPVREGRPVAYTPPAWIARGRAGAIEVPTGLDVVWVEGTGVLRRELDPWIDASVYVQGDLDVQERRLSERDGDSPEVREHVASWLAEEIPFMAREKPWAHTTLLIDGTSTIARMPDEVVVAEPVSASSP